MIRKKKLDALLLHTAGTFSAPLILTETYTKRLLKMYALRLKIIIM